jgi:uncharacterized protein (DUF362 family)
MASLLRTSQRAFLGTALLAIVASQMQSCASDDDGVVDADGGSSAVSEGGTGNPATGGDGLGADGTGGTATQGGASETGQDAATVGGLAGGDVSNGGATAVGGSDTTFGTSATGGLAAVGGTTAVEALSYVVAIVQSSKAKATDITQDDITTMVADAVTEAGGLDFIHDGQTVVLKPNLLTHLSACWSGTATLSPTSNGVTTDWRITKAVADLVRAKNPTGKILVMEGSNRNTTTAFTVLGYTSDNFGASVDEFIAIEGSGCDSRSQDGLVQKAGHTGTQYWINNRYFEADVIISLGALKSHSSAGITGCVKNVGIGATPNAMYSVSTNSADCSRSKSYIDHSFAGLGDFVSDYYSIKPVDFAIMDGLQGLQNGPCSTNAADRKNMRLILAGKNAVALDTVEAAVMNCTGSKVPYLAKLEDWGMGTTDLSKISVVGNKTIADVQQSFTGAAGGVCD